MKLSKIAFASAIGGAGYLYGRSKTKDKTPEKETVDQEVEEVEVAPVNLLRLANFNPIAHLIGPREEGVDPYIFGQGFIAGEVFNANKEWLESMVVSEEAAESFLSFWMSGTTEITKQWTNFAGMTELASNDPDAENRKVLLENQFYGMLAELAFTHSLELITSMRHLSGVADDKLLEGYSGDRVIYETIDALVYYDDVKKAPKDTVMDNMMGMFGSTFGGALFSTMSRATDKPVPSHRALCEGAHYDALKGVLLKLYKTPFLGADEYWHLVNQNEQAWSSLGG